MGSNLEVFCSESFQGLNFQSDLLILHDVVFLNDGDCDVCFFDVVWLSCDLFHVL